MASTFQTLCLGKQVVPDQPPQSTLPTSQFIDVEAPGTGPQVCGSGDRSGPDRTGDIWLALSQLLLVSTAPSAPPLRDLIWQLHVSPTSVTTSMILSTCLQVYL